MVACHLHKQPIGRAGVEEHMIVQTGAEAVVAIMSKVTRQAISYQYIPKGDMRSVLLQVGLPPAGAEFLLLILEFFKAGYSERTTDAVQMPLGRPLTTLEQYAANYRSAWVKADEAPAIADPM